jgi:hypothetical protein
MKLRAWLTSFLADETTPVRVKVDGEVKMVRICDLVRVYQKNAAADNRLRDATAKLRAAEKAGACSAS